jgi:hypothetical protein
MAETLIELVVEIEESYSELAKGYADTIGGKEILATNKSWLYVRAGSRAKVPFKFVGTQQRTGAEAAQPERHLAIEFDRIEFVLANSVS